MVVGVLFSTSEGTVRLSVEDVSKLCKVPERTVYRWVKQGKLPAHRVNDQYHFNRAEVLEWATAQRITLSADLFTEPDNASPLPSISQALREGGVFYDVRGTDKASVLRAIVDLMILPEKTDRQMLLQILLARESMGSTAVGDGIAIPHVRNPIVLDVPLARISLCFLKTPIEFGAIDSRPVHTLFALISPTVRAHLHMLSVLAYTLRDESFKAELMRRGSADELLNQMRRVETKVAEKGRP